MYTFQSGLSANGNNANANKNNSNKNNSDTNNIIVSKSAFVKTNIPTIVNCKFNCTTIGE